MRTHQGCPITAPANAPASITMPTTAPAPHTAVTSARSRPRRTNTARMPPSDVSEKNENHGAISGEIQASISFSLRRLVQLQEVRARARIDLPVSHEQPHAHLERIRRLVLLDNPDALDDTVEPLPDRRVGDAVLRREVLERPRGEDHPPDEL